MNRRGIAVALAWLALAGAPIAVASAQLASQRPSPAVAMIADFAKTFHDKGVRAVIVYSELDNGDSPSDKKVGITVSGIVADTNQVIAYKGDTAEIMKAISGEAAAGGWGKTLIVVDNGAVTVEHGPSPGSIDGFQTRAEQAVADAAVRIVKVTPVGV